MSIGTRIASVRGFRRMTQDQLGGLVGVPSPAHDANGLTWDVVGGGLLVRVGLAA